MEDDLSGFEDQFDGVTPDIFGDDLVVTEMQSTELASLIYNVNRKLAAHKQSLHPTEQWARDAHSQREAARVELALRTRR